jgi:hypothetical protein
LRRIHYSTSRSNVNTFWPQRKKIPKIFSTGLHRASRRIFPRGCTGELFFWTAAPEKFFYEAAPEKFFYAAAPDFPRVAAPAAFSVPFAARARCLA